MKKEKSFRSFIVGKGLGLIFILLPIVACKEGRESGNKSASLGMEDNKKTIELVRNDEGKKIDVKINGKLFTSYIYPGTLEKPVLYPILTARGNSITRGFPLDPRPGERIDHPHQVGLWFNYGDVNGLDFWNNSYAIPEGEKDHYGSIRHKEINTIKSGNDKGVLAVTMDWVGPDKNILLKENTTFVFRESDNKRIIDRITTLMANEKVSMHDNKEGMMGMRVARQLELPSNKPEKFTDKNGNPTDVAVMDNEGVTGWYRSSEGVEGEAAWGTRAKWMSLKGNINGEDISVVILDHPENIGYPTYWHARGYGLFAANPLGQKAMSGGKEELNFELAAGEAVTFKYRIIVYSGNEITDQLIEQDFQQFTNPAQRE